MGIKMTVVLAAGLCLALPATAGAQNYPTPSDPGQKVERPRGKPATLHVCKARKANCFRKIQAAVNAARPGDSIRVQRGVYREGVQVSGRGKARIKLIGDRKRPGKVVLDGYKLKGPAAQNGVLVNNADAVTVAGFKARGYKGNGFFAINVTGYTFTDLIAERTGAYGIYAFNSKGGSMTDSTAYWNNDSGFYVGQTPRQAKPKRTLVKNVTAYANTLGFSGTNMRYVTITKSRWFNNGLGIVPSSLDSERFAPPQDNVIIGNQIFWNNFNYYAGAPYALRDEAADLSGYPVGTGILLFGGQRHRVEDNDVYGNWLVGIGAIQQILQGKTKQDPDAQRGILKGNEFVGNTMGLAGQDLNGRDMFYDGSGSGNCFSDNTLLSPNLPSDNSTFTPCPFTGANTLVPAVQGEALGWVAAGKKEDPGTFESAWIRQPHKAQKGIRPLVRCADDPECRKAQKGTASIAKAAATAKRTVKVGDYFFKPRRLAFGGKVKITWKWPGSPGDQHDVKLRKGPKGVKKFQSKLAASDYSFARTLSVSGTYKLICTLHPDSMRQIITLD